MFVCLFGWLVGWLLIAFVLVVVLLAAYVLVVLVVLVLVLLLFLLLVVAHHDVSGANISQHTVTAWQVCQGLPADALQAATRSVEAIP